MTLSRKIRYIALSSLLVTQTMHLCALTRDQYLLGIAGATALVTGIWGYAERCNKHDLRLELAKATKELDFIKSEQCKAEKDQEFLAIIGKLIKHVQQQYYQELALFNNQIRGYNEESIASLMHILQARIQLNHSSTKKFKETLKQDLAQVHDMYQKLLLKIVEWNQAGAPKIYNKEAVRAQESLQALELFLEAFDLTLEHYSSTLDLALVLTKDYSALYTTEIKLYEQKANKDFYMQELDKYIRAQYSDASYQFPYLAYAEQLRRDNGLLKHALEYAQASAPTQFLQELKHNALVLLEMLDLTLETIAISPMYTQEKAHKPEFDRQEAKLKAELHEKQEKLNAELRESQARIEKEKKLVETQLQAEANRARELANQKAELERERKALELKSQEVMLEIARMRDGDTIREAIKQNNSDWQYKYNSLQSKYDSTFKKQTDLQQELENTQTNNRSEINRLSNDIAQLQSKIKNHESQVYTLNQKVQNLQEKAERATTTLAQLEGHNPPFNPDIIDGLRDYIKNLKTYAKAAKNALA